MNSHPIARPDVPAWPGYDCSGSCERCLAAHLERSFVLPAASSVHNYGLVAVCMLVWSMPDTYRVLACAPTVTYGTSCMHFGMLAMHLGNRALGVFYSLCCLSTAKLDSCIQPLCSMASASAAFSACVAFLHQGVGLSRTKSMVEAARVSTQHVSKLHRVYAC